MMSSPTYLSRIELQKRGAPHCQLLIFLSQDNNDFVLNNVNEVENKMHYFNYQEKIKKSSYASKCKK